jgi:hypothetical protein
VNIFKKIITFSACLLVSIVGTVAVLFLITEMNFDFPEVREIEITGGESTFSINEKETLSVLVFSRSKIMPVVNDPEHIINFDNLECLEIKETSFQIQTQSSGGDYLSGVSLFSITWECADVGEIKVLVDEHFFLENNYSIGVQGGYGEFFFNILIMIFISILLSLVLYRIATKVLLRGLKKGSD